ncbi:DNA-3-methyladenine glycosylase-like isoform X1 [Octopus sinensis]|uniref:DNA-3-methyladenine glycosylase n=1 Tax=Octopus sinensis TaxID=2607531 RepID=A0A6P7SSA5_9MOLL|nr:DNA-3-methyladenine glycosylase-like isoform X1 [Octopus sinensis]XP_036362085.1 DNA-3-methyladenine glycosylase-like isoform X1 [Octopus sinensis]XP_036362086.1 DNA-3-methyladenine glycosylase-like isoform X1 [Octopus sinensis]XP_036362087.1 DNA-3-methyladenine glycosylase-like isoform X1 [Octopus sinensis]XP_036362089.1 DNA-3-methyladenine glycosylase-like isoform X1 [Octopus sinensis]XP_036362090.1 DNA-3-methyladenine glycosylase-like isoform X1 [Octopus sinensis]XP_036362091.1 DNA-3-me
MAPKKRQAEHKDSEITTCKYFAKQNKEESSSSIEKLFDPCLRLIGTFYQKECVELSRALLGKYIVRAFDDGSQVCGKIVETEAYCGIEDACSHSYNNRRTKRTEAMFMPPGTLYVYTIYGMYSCMNISSSGDGCAVLIRALQPISGLEKMQSLRSKKNPLKPIKEKNLCSGPSKLCQALDVTKETFNKEDLITSNRLWLSSGDTVEDSEIDISKRINITGDEIWVNKPLRFFIKYNPYVSVKNAN